MVFQCFMASINVIKDEEDGEDEGRRVASLFPVTQTKVWVPLAYTDYQICISCGLQFNYKSSLKEHIMLLFFRICLEKMFGSLNYSFIILSKSNIWIVDAFVFPHVITQPEKYETI